MRLALLSNITADLLSGMLGKPGDIYLAAGFDTWQQEMLMPASGLYAFQPEAVVVLLHADAYAYAWNTKEEGERLIEEWCAAFKTVCVNLARVPVFVSSVDISIRCHYGAEARLEQHFEAYFVEKVQELYADGMSIYILPVREAIADVGRSGFYAPKMWYMGSMPYSVKGLASLAELIWLYVSAAAGMRRKCLAVDLDNTLWGGVIGEDGVEGIELSAHKEGARYRDAQAILKKMKEQGVMLAILSKNNADDVETAFHHPGMVLRREDFVAEAINWEAKSVNLKKLALQLNIGLDSFVFLDDNPAEREQMRVECPEVAVIEFPKDSSHLPAVLADAYQRYFLSLEVTEEDAGKTAMYRAENNRRAEMDSSVSVRDFLKKLEMKMDIHFMRLEEEKRVAQLVNKTNQFNVTTKRYSEKEIHELGKNDGSDVITVHMSDKYGDQGLAAVVILKYGEDDIAEGTKTVWAEIDSFLMSCRVMGRDAETEIMAHMKDYLIQKGVRVLKASYVRTAKNAPAADLFGKLQFETVAETLEGKRYLVETSSLPAATNVFKEITVGL